MVDNGEVFEWQALGKTLFVDRASSLTCDITCSECSMLSWGTLQDLWMDRLTNRVHDILEDVWVLVRKNEDQPPPPPEKLEVGNVVWARHFSSRCRALVHSPTQLIAWTDDGMCRTRFGDVCKSSVSLDVTMYSEWSTHLAIRQVLNWHELQMESIRMQQDSSTDVQIGARLKEVDKRMDALFDNWIVQLRRR